MLALPLEALSWSYLSEASTPTPKVSATRQAGRRPGRERADDQPRDHRGLPRPPQDDLRPPTLENIRHHRARKYASRDGAGQYGVRPIWRRRSAAAQIVPGNGVNSSVESW